MTPTVAQIARFTSDLSRMAKEPVTVEYISGTFYAYGSELACLRLFKEYNKVVRNERTATNWSANLNTFYFRLETEF